jgi:uncharacterized protein (TIGR02466 family)
MIHTIFPTAIGEYHFAGYTNKKNIYLNNIQKYIVKKNDNECIVGESTGFTYIHVDPIFTDIFTFVTHSIKEHFNNLKFDHTIFDIVIVKSWLNILTNNTSTPNHIHDTSHYSFVFYLNVPENSDQLCFHIQRNPNEPFSGSFFDYGKDSDVKTLISEYNTFNSLNYSFNPTEGNVFVFPSNLSHYTKKIGNMNNSHRISISGDILLVYKEELNPNYPTGMFPVSKWRIFD